VGQGCEVLRREARMRQLQMFRNSRSAKSRALSHGGDSDALHRLETSGCENARDRRCTQPHWRADHGSAGKKRCGTRRLRVQGRHVRAGYKPAATLVRYGANRCGWNDRDAATHCRCQSAARRSRVPGAGRLHERAGPYAGGGWRLRLTLAVRDRSPLDISPKDGRIFAAAEQLRHHYAVRPAL